MKRLRRAWLVWLALPEVIRMGLLLAGFIVLAILSGCQPAT